MKQETLRGGCLCGAVAYEVKAPYLRFAHCYCSRCRKATGASHASNLYVSPERFTWTSGQDLVVRFDLPSAKSFATTFCRRCGGPLPHHTRSGREIIVPASRISVTPLTPDTDSRRDILASGRAPAFVEIQHDNLLPDLAGKIRSECLKLVHRRQHYPVRKVLNVKRRHLPYER